MRKSGPGLYGIAVPAAALIGAVCGDSAGAMFTVCAWQLAFIASLGAADAFRRASAKLMSTRKVMGALLTAVLMIAAGCAAVGCAYWFSGDELNRQLMPWIGAGAILAVNRCFEELFASQGDLSSARLTDTLTFIALTACLLIPMEFDALGKAVCAASGGVTVIGGCIALGFARREPPQLNLALFKEIPAAMARTALFPIACAAAMVLLGYFDFSDDMLHAFSLLESSAYAGLILMELAKSTFRRGKSESAGLKTGVALSVLLISAAILAAFCFLPLSHAPQSMAVMLLAGACAMLLYAPFDWESIAAMIVMIAGAAAIGVGFTPDHASFPQEIFVGPAAGVILCALMFRQWGDLHRRSRANRIRKRAMKKSRSK